MIIKWLIIANTYLGLPSGLLPAVCSVESDFRNITSWNDGGSPSFGICQIKLLTARDMLPNVTQSMLMNPSINGLAAGLYLKWQLKRYNNNLECAISAYNAGRCIKSNKKTYVDKVKKRMSNYKILP